MSGLHAALLPPDVASPVVIQGVFQAIVEASMEQMEAYGELVSGVAKTVDQFSDRNASGDLALKSRGYSQGRFVIDPANLGISEHRVHAFQLRYAEAMELPIADD